MKPQIVDIENFDKESKKLQEKSRVIQNLFVQLAFDYINKISGKHKNDKFYQCRDNISYRISSCLFLNSKAWEIRIDYEQEQFNPIFMGSAQYPILWMTDSLIFNLASLFDYIGGFLEFIVGTEGKNEMKWNSVYKSFLNKEPHKDSLFAKTVKLIHVNFVNKLYGFRSIVIHNKVQAGGFSYNHELTSDKKSLHQFCSNGFLKNFKNLKKEFPDKNITIQYANFWLLLNSLDYLTELLNITTEHFEQNRKIPKGKEIIFREGT